MAMTLRLPQDLAERGRRYAAELGISFNGLLAVALREYSGREEARIAHATAAANASAGASSGAASQGRTSAAEYLNSNSMPF